ncbi:GTP-binding protein [Neolecta irregularis DAH-3]|uniref:GTP-binding protein n=1 Tax=Neolecta irregularis (strain DAH-3) TaxID=1198029 RepID=A0A1U7LTY2_NEOID|nr:GTP-binding protein [Neolecta irregularis DAH-3]|eukprot:OLL26130.1 GTP-binding protein [Neolecta irregularis DAH-3]
MTTPKPVYKVIVIGDNGVGKTSLRTRFLYGKFTSSYRATIGADFLTKNINGMTLSIWDTAGQERFNSLGSSNPIFRGTDAAIFVFDSTNASSFASLEKWLTQFLSSSGSPSPTIVLVGNKIDIPERTITSKQAQNFAQSKWKAKAEDVFFCSAKTDHQVKEVFNRVAYLLQNKIDGNQFQMETATDTVNLGRRSTSLTSKCCF